MQESTDIDRVSQQPPPAILVVTCSSQDVGRVIEESIMPVSPSESAGQDGISVSNAIENVECQAVDDFRQRSLSPFPVLETGNDILELRPLTSPSSSSNPVNVSHHQKDTAKAEQTQPYSKSFYFVTPRLKFCVREAPPMSRGDQVRFLRRFRFGDTYKLKNRSWLIPQFLSGALTLTGVVLTLVGIISLQINKYLHACDADDGIDCKSNNANINNVMMPIGVGTTGGGLSLILISGFVFVHAFCVIYEDADNEEDGTHDGVLHIPTSARAALLASSTALSPEDIARCQSYYDNLQGYAGNH